MTALLPRLLCLWLLAGTSVAVKFTQCQLARILQEEGLDGYGGIFLEEWMCLVYFSSRYDTESSEYQGYGLFQLNPRFWCKRPGQESQNKCSMCCSKLQDGDLSDDVRCIKKVVLTSGGINLFEPWGKDLHEHNYL